MATLRVLSTGPQATVQDQGRPGWTTLGVGRSGAADRKSLRLGNRLLGNDAGAAGIEVTFGGLGIRPDATVLVAVTGAPGQITVNGSPESVNAPFTVPAGSELRLGVPTAGVRTYLTVRGGVDVPAVLGSRSTDTLAGLGPAALTEGTSLPVGPTPREAPLVDVAPVAAPPEGVLRLRVRLGPRDDWFTDDAVQRLLGMRYTVTAESDRVGMRLDGAPLTRSREEELPSEGMVVGSLQVPPSGLPTLFLADHPVTGGYPVIAVVLRDDVDLAAQARPGQPLHFTPQS